MAEGNDELLTRLDTIMKAWHEEESSFSWSGGTWYIEEVAPPWTFVWLPLLLRHLFSTPRLLLSSSLLLLFSLSLSPSSELLFPSSSACAAVGGFHGASLILLWLIVFEPQAQFP